MVSLKAFSFDWRPVSGWVEYKLLLLLLIVLLLYCYIYIYIYTRIYTHNTD